MGRDRGRRAGVQVAGRADLQMQSARTHRIDQMTSLRIAERIDQADAMSDARCAEVGGFDHALRDVGLACMQRDADAGVTYATERARMQRGRKTRFGTREVEADHAFIALAERRGLPAFAPERRFCTDNAAMIAAAADRRADMSRTDARTLVADPNLRFN